MNDTERKWFTFFQMGLAPILEGTVAHALSLGHTARVAFYGLMVYSTARLRTGLELSDEDVKRATEIAEEAAK